jgi:hygromycin-B 7''-O-kinase
MATNAGLPSAVDTAGWRALLDDDAALAAGVHTLLARHGLADLPRQRYDSGSLPVYAVGDSQVLKLFPPHEADHAAVEAAALAAVRAALPIPTPRLHAVDSQDGWHGLLMSQLQGQRLVDAWPALSAVDRDRMADELGATMAALHALDTTPMARLTPRWSEFIPEQAVSAAQRQRQRGLDEHWVEQVPEFLQRCMPPPVPRHALLHTELMREHLMAAQAADGWRLTGLFDFEPAMVGAPEYDFASFGLFVTCGDPRLLRRALLAYGYPPQAMDHALQCRLMAYALLHRYSNLAWYLRRLPLPGATRLEQLAAYWWGID